MAKRSISLPDDLDAAIAATAQLEGLSVSAWIAEITAREVKRTAGLAAVAEWEAENGAFTEAEMAAAHEWVRDVLAADGPGAIPVADTQP